MYKLIKIFIYSLIILVFLSGVITASPRFFLMYVVQPGDTLLDVAKNYQVSIDSIIEKNNL
ncbi:MAG: LysM peptidoglycan-binding domain-containing protein, partial [Bacillota bacterium]